MAQLVNRSVAYHTYIAFRDAKEVGDIGSSFLVIKTQYDNRALSLIQILNTLLEAVTIEVRHSKRRWRDEFSTELV
jgi:hypothetical protein